jgi:exopolysaccharide biosynthesis polyprenyl glycosylphosphotransferase
LSSLILVALITLAFAIGTGHNFSTYGLAPTAVVFCAVTIAVLRTSYELVTGEVLRSLGARRYALLAGSGENVARLRTALGSGRSGIDYEFVGAVAPSPEGVGLPVLGDVPDLPAVLDRERVDELIVTDSDFGERELLEIVDHAHRRGVDVRIAPKATELLTSRVEFVPGQGIPLFELRPPAFIGMDWVVKRGFDLVVSGVVLLAGLPVWLAIAAAVKLSSRGPVLYRDRRVGLGEQEFGMLKFRTMRADAAVQQAELEASNEADGPLFKIREDPRVTGVGAFLRRFSLDEVPQLWNILRGEMSLVGPRPLPLRDYERLEAWHRKRYLVLPGVTGLWQISGRSNLGFDDLVRLDFYYLENWSLMLDVSILVKTVPAVLAGRGAY